MVNLGLTFDLICFFLGIATLCLIIDILRIIKRSPPGLLHARTFLKGLAGTYPQKLLLVLGAVIAINQATRLVVHSILPSLPPNIPCPNRIVDTICIGIGFIIIVVAHRDIKNLARISGGKS